MQVLFEHAEIHRHNGTERKAMKIVKKWVEGALAAFVGASALFGTTAPVKAKSDLPDPVVTSAPSSAEDWGSLRLDMKGVEENDDSGNWGTPLGNGWFMAKENGGADEDVFVLNHSTFWSGDPQYRDALYEGKEGYRHSAAERAAGYQELIETFKKAYAQGVTKPERDRLMGSVNEITQKMWESDEQGAFLSAGRMKMKFSGLDNPSDYKRILDLDRAISEVSFVKDNTGYLRETFISKPDNVMVTRMTNDGNKSMDMELSLSLPREMVGKSVDNKVRVDTYNMEIVMTGRAPYDFPATRWDDNRGTLLESRAKIILPSKGNVSVQGDSLKVSGADEIIVLYTSETSFKDALTDPSSSGVKYQEKVRHTLDEAGKKTYAELLERHLDDYRSLFRRLWIDLDGESILAADGRTWQKPENYAMHYQFVRYTNIAVDRENSLMPYGLFGIWQPTWTSVNEGAYFLNENMEKMQMMKGAANLADVSTAQYRFISDWTKEETGQRTAQTIYGAEDGAWMMSHSTGIWAKSGMWGSEVEWGSWLNGGIWALDSLYDKYDYTQDIELLKQYYPIFEGAAKFALSSLIEVDGVNGELKGYKVAAPAGSPEHWYWVNGKKNGFDIASTCDTLLFYNLFNILEKSAAKLEQAGVDYDKAFLKRVLETREQMIPLEMFIDENTGHLKEWYNEYEIGDYRHRHASHLLGLFLSNVEITPYDTPELWEAQKKELNRWKDANGGAHPDRSLMALRCGYPDYALSALELIGTDYNHDSLMFWGQLTNAIPEAVLDSRYDSINIMENMPSAWTGGSVKGICARGGYQLSIEWKNGELVRCVIDSTTGRTPSVFYKGEPVILANDDRFVVNRATTSLEQLQKEAGENLDEKYTLESRKMLESVANSTDKEELLNALMAMEPSHYMIREVTITAEDDIHVLSGRGSTLQLFASSDKKDARYEWSIEAIDGSSAERIAGIDSNGLVTAIGGGKVRAIASIKGEPKSFSSIELTVDAETYELAEYVDDRDDRIVYSTGWSTWDEEKHNGGTITYSLHAGERAELTFTGTGFELIGSSADHIGDFRVYLDGKVLADRVDAGALGYNKILYSLFGLEDTSHTLVIESLDERIDMDAVNLYESVPAETLNSHAVYEQVMRMKSALCGLDLALAQSF